MEKRPAVTVVMPFAGDWAAAQDAARTLCGLQRNGDDELILVDNSGDAARLTGVSVIAATDERSPAHARNAGAAAASGDWVLFIDADCRPRSDLLEQYFAEPLGDDVGALAGEVVGDTQAADTSGPARLPLAARYGATKSFLSQREHLAHPYLPRAVAANLLVRRTAFEQVGGFYEGLRAAEDTDFAWRLQQAGWRLELRPQAWVKHRYRTTLTELRRQWRGYAAGRAWLARRYEGFLPQPALRRALGRPRRKLGGARTGPTAPQRPQEARSGVGRVERGKYLAIDAVLALEELAGFLLSNRPAAKGRRAAPAQATTAEPPHVVFVADRFPSAGDPLVELPSALGARVEAAGRPRVIPPDAQGLHIHYREDDGLAQRLTAVIRLCVTHPLLCLRDGLSRRGGEASLMALAPAVLRLQRDRDARLQSLGGGEAPAVARRLAKLADRRAP